MRFTAPSARRKYWRLSVSDGVPRRSLKVALVVGVVLNLINQGPTIFAGLEPVWWKVGLTFVVPYLVATYGAVSAKMAAASTQCTKSEGGGGHRRCQQETGARPSSQVAEP